jgi:predicted dehydrogenase
LVGCGMIAGCYEDFLRPEVYSHAKGYLRHKGFAPLGFVDSDPARADLLATKASGMSFANIEELLSKFRPDVVSVCVPDDLHFQTLEALMLSPCRPRLIFAEKPVCDTRKQLDQILDYQARYSIPVVVNHSRRFDVMHTRIRGLLTAGDFGRPMRIHVDYYGGWKHLGVHAVDILQYFFNTPMKISGAEYYCHSKYPDDPTLNVNATLAGAPVCFAGFPEACYQILDINIQCERGQIKLTDFGKRVEVLGKTVNAELESVLVAVPGWSNAGMQSPMLKAIEVIADYLAHGNRDILEPYGLEQASMTMNTIWKGFEIYDA